MYKPHTSEITSKSVTADDIGPHILAQHAISQSHLEQNGAYIESPSAAHVDS
jgi:hypothetical protein